MSFREVKRRKGNAWTDEKWRKAHSRDLLRKGGNTKTATFKVFVERSMSGPAGSKFYAAACPSSRGSARCAGGHGATPTRATKAALRKLASVLK